MAAPLDPETYLLHPKFSRQITCPRTQSPVSFADLGDEDGEALLWILPSGGSRWFAVPHDPLCKRRGIRLIVVDRPGFGATHSVPLNERIEVSSQHIVSVLEHLNVKPAHILAVSAGIYYALHLLVTHPEAFRTRLSPPPRVYLVSPWSPLLPPEHEDYYASYFNWIPTTLISTQHYTVPHLARAGKEAVKLWDTGKSYWDSAKSWTSSTFFTPPDGGSGGSSAGLPVVYAPPIPVVEGDQAPKSNATWTTDHATLSKIIERHAAAENFEGIGQDHLICLNRGSDTGHEWFIRALDRLSEALHADHKPITGTGTGTSNDPAKTKNSSTATPPTPMRVDIWWGWQDSMVPRAGQLYLNKIFEAHSDVVQLWIHNVPDGDHNDLLGRRDGIFQVYDMVQAAAAEGRHRDSDSDSA